MKNQRNAAIQWFAVLVLVGATMSTYIRNAPGQKQDQTVATRTT